MEEYDNGGRRYYIFFKSSTDSILTVLCRELRGDVMVVSGGMIGDRARDDKLRSSNLVLAFD